MIWWLLYAASVVVSYVLQRIALRMDRLWYATEFGWSFIVTLLPGMNLLYSICVLLEAAKDRNTLHPILWLYGIRGDDVQRVLEARGK